MESEQTMNETEPQGGEAEAKQKPRFFNVYNIIGIVLCVLLLPGFFISTVLLFSSLINKDAPPSCFGITPLMVETGSMIPVFDEDDLVLIKNTGDDATFKEGDIICFQSGDYYVTHRIKEVTTDEDGKNVYTTQGDANNAPDAGSVSSDQILGVYKTRWKGMGKVLLFIQTPIGMILTVFLPIILVLLLFLLPPILLARKAQKSESATEETGDTDKTDDAPDGQDAMRL